MNDSRPVALTKKCMSYALKIQIKIGLPNSQLNVSFHYSHTEKTLTLCSWWLTQLALQLTRESFGVYTISRTAMSRRLSGMSPGTGQVGSEARAQQTIRVSLMRGHILTFTGVINTSEDFDCPDRFRRHLCAVTLRRNKLTKYSGFRNVPLTSCSLHQCPPKIFI